MSKVFENNPALKWALKLYDDAHAVVTVLNAFCEPTTIADVVERGLLLAKREPRDRDMMQAKVYAQLNVDVGATTEKFLLEDPQSLHNWWNACEAERGAFRGRLSELMASPSKSRAKNEKADIRILREQMLITCEISNENEIGHRYFPLTTEAAYIYVLMALYHPKQERWRRLKECGFCRTVFIRKVSEVGGRPRSYCTPECLKKADHKKALIRQKARRKRNRK